MNHREKTIRWIPMDIEAAIKLTELTTNPGKVYKLDIKDAPKNFTRMEGACSYYVSAYPKPVQEGGVTIGGKILIGRTDGDTLKNYPHYFASSSDNKIYYAKGNFHFPGHHIKSANSINVKEMFDHKQLGERTKP